MKLGSPSLLRQDSTRHRPACGDRSFAYRVQVVAQITCILTVIALWPHVDMPLQLAVWWLGMTITQVLLLGLAHPLHNREHGESDDQPLRHYFSSASAIIGGAAWGSLALVGPYHASPQAQAGLFMVLGGITLAGAGILRFSRSSYAVFMVATLLPLFILSIVTPPSAFPEAGLWLTAFALFAFSLNGLQHTRSQAAAARRPDRSNLFKAQQSMLDNAGAAIVMSRGNRIESCNRRFAEMMQGSLHDIAGRSLAAWFEDRADWPRHARAASAAMRRGETYRNAARLRRRDGSVFWAEISGQVVDADETAPRVVWAAVDMTERMMATAREQLVSAQLHALIGKSADWYWQTDVQHRLMHVTRHIDRRDDPLKRNIGRKWWHFHRLDRGQPAGQLEVREAFERSQGFRHLMVELPDGANPPLWLRISGTPRVDEHGAFLGHHGIATDVTEEVRGSERIRHLAYHDALTGLPNRRLLTDRLAQAISRARRYRTRVGVILVDLDDFRRINDLGGHAAGDQALLETADRLRACVRACDTVARLGSDEFVIVLAELDDATDADSVAAKVLSTLHRPLNAGGPHTPVSTSIGVAIFPEDAHSVDSLIEVADARMFRAKRRGGQRIENREGSTASRSQPLPRDFP